MRWAVAASLLLALPLWGQVKFRPEADRIQVEIDGKHYTTFYLAPGGNKPYVYPLTTASGIVVTRHFPMETFPCETNDHPHHRGMFFAHGDVNGYNFRAAEPGTNSAKAGRMVLKKVLEAKGGQNKSAHSPMRIPVWRRRRKALLLRSSRRNSGSQRAGDVVKTGLPQRGVVEKALDENHFCQAPYRRCSRRRLRRANRS